MTFSSQNDNQPVMTGEAGVTRAKQDDTVGRAAKLLIFNSETAVTVQPGALIHAVERVGFASPNSNLSDPR